MDIGYHTNNSMSSTTYIKTKIFFIDCAKNVFAVIMEQIHISGKAPQSDA